MAFWDKSVEVQKASNGGQVFVDVNKDSTTTVTTDAQGHVQSISITAKGPEVDTLQKLRTNLRANVTGEGSETVNNKTVTFSNKDGSLTKCDFEAIMSRPEHKDLLDTMKKNRVEGHEAGANGETTYLHNVGKKPAPTSCGKGI
jgi:hypothetical protein